MLRIILLAMFCLYLVTDQANCQIKDTKVESTSDGRFIFVEQTNVFAPDSSLTYSGYRTKPMTKEELQGILTAQQSRVDAAEADIDAAKTRAQDARRQLKALEREIGRANRDMLMPETPLPNATGQVGVELLSTWRDTPIPPDDIPEITTKYKVLYVYDGDTYYVQAGTGMLRIRPVGFDCDEVQGKYMSKGQPFGSASRDSIRAWLTGDSIELDIKGLDIYGRTLAQVKWRGQDMAVLLLRKGWADYYTSSYIGPNTRKAYQRERDAAKRAKRGRWAGSDVMTPKKWRALYQIKNVTQ